MRWCTKTSSLNWVNKKKLSQHILKIEHNLHGAKETLLDLLSQITHLEAHCKELVQKSREQQLTAKHILEIKPLLTLIEDFKLGLEKLPAGALKGHEKIILE